MVLFLRLLPLLIACLEAAVFWLQLRQPLSYPWIVLLGVLALPLATVLIAWKRLPIRDAFERMLPSFVLIASLAFALLLVEGPVAVWMVVVLAALTALISLEFLFLLVYDPPRYPVNGLSRANIAFVPIAVWYAASTSNGLIIFLHVSPAWHVALMVVIGALLFRTTGHTGATAREQGVWSLVGMVVGLHAGLLGIMLPVAMPVHGLISAMLMSASLRVRRYVYEPRLSARQAWIEGSAALILFTTALATAKWL